MAVTKDRISAKLRRRLSVLPPTASKESIRTLTRWMLFHIQHHPHSLLQTLRNELTTKAAVNVFNTSGSGSKSMSSMSQQSHPIVCWNVIHETCTSYSAHDTMGGFNEEKWTSSSLHDFRVSMAESVIRPGLEHLLSLLRAQPRGSINSNNSNSNIQGALLVRDKLQNMAQIWQQLNCFDSITLVDELKRLILKIVQEEGSSAGDGTSSTDADADANAIPVRANDVTQPSTSASSYTDAKESVTLPQSQGGPTTAKTDAPMQLDETPTVENETVDFEMGDDDDDDRDDNNDPSISMDGNDKKNADGDANVESSSATVPTTPQDEEEIMTAPSIDIEKGSLDVSMEENMDDKEEDKGDNETSPSKVETKEREKEKMIVKEFDFESEGIPQGKVEVFELKEPCTSIATMQITRDLRNDSSYNLSSLLSKVPSAVMDACKVAKGAKEDDNNTTTDATTTTALKDAKSKVPITTIPDDVLDLDIGAALANVKLHREIIQKQKEYRKQCIELLIKSRCEFGSTEAAELFYSLKGIGETLKKRKALILDAMELEGLDFDALGDEDDENQDDKDLGEFSWLSKEQAENVKKQRTIE